MKRFLIVTALLTAVNSIFADNEIRSVLSQVAQNNLTLQALKHEGEAQVLDMKAENVLGGPTVEYSPFFKDGYGGVAESELVVSEEIQFPTKYAMRRKQASLHQQTTEQTYNKEKRDILLQAKLLCLDIIRVNQTVNMLTERMEGSNTLKQMYAKRMEAGDANVLEVNKVELDRMEVQTLLSEAQNERTMLLQLLQQLNGGKEIDVKTMEFPEEEAIGDYDTFVKLALLSDADIQTAEASLRSAMHEVATAKKEWLPNITMGYRRNTSVNSEHLSVNSEQLTVNNGMSTVNNGMSTVNNEKLNGFLIGLSFPLVSNKNKIRAAKNRQKSMEMQVEQTRLDRETQLRSCYQQMMTLQQILDHSDVKMMQETLSLLSKALQHGEISALQYYTEINSIYEKLQRHIDVHCQSAKLKAQLHKHELDL